MATTNGKSGNCSNFGNCSVADTRAIVEVPNGMDFVCNECGKPLLLTETGGKGGSAKLLAIIALVIVVLAGTALGSWAFFGKGKNSAMAVEKAPTSAASDKSGAKQPANPSGDCSEQDRKAGLCTKTP